MNTFHPAAAFPAETPAHFASRDAQSLPDDLDRAVYCILGMPVDAVTMADAVQRVRSAASGSAPYLISTPNLNFLVNSLTDPAFRTSLLQSDLCTADGMPVVWIARLIGVPLRERVAGASLYDELRGSATAGTEPVPAFLFGGPEGAAEAACARLRREQGGLRCAGYLYPGFGSVEDLSTSEIIGAINRSGARFLVVSLGAMKGQLWLCAITTLYTRRYAFIWGAAINFAAGTVARAPRIFQRLGLEWLWRIWQEPQLWRRYWNDGQVLVRLMATRVLPLVIARLWSRVTRKGSPVLSIQTTQTPHGRCLVLRGAATAGTAAQTATAFRSAIASGAGSLTVDLGQVSAIDARFLGLLMMLVKTAKARGIQLQIVASAGKIKKPSPLMKRATF